MCLRSMAASSSNVVAGVWCVGLLRVGGVFAVSGFCVFESGVYFFALAKPRKSF